MGKGIELNGVRNRLTEFIRREDDALQLEEELEARLKKEEDLGELLGVYRDIISEVESEEANFQQILELEKEKFEEAVQVWDSKVRYERRKYEVILDFEQQISQMTVTARQLKKDFSQEKFEKFLQHQNELRSDLNKIKQLEQHEFSEVNVNNLLELAKDSKEALENLKILVNHPTRNRIPLRIKSNF